MKIIILLALLLGSNLVIASDLEKIFDNVRSSSTGVRGVSDPRSNGMSFGSYTMRNKLSNAPLVSFRPPSISAGCNGIDIYAGSFSLISKDQIVQTMRGIAQGAATYAFGLAMDNLCPNCSDNMKELQNKLQEINKWSIDSCKAAQRLVDGSGLTAQLAAMRDSTARTEAAARGMVEDSGSYMANGGDPIKDLVESGLEYEENVSFNATFALIKKLKFDDKMAKIIVGSGTAPSVEDKYKATLLLMNWFGIAAQDYINNDKEMDYQVITPSFGLKEMIFKKIDPNDAFYVCSDANDMNCVSPSNDSSKLVDLGLNKPLQEMIKEKIITIDGATNKLSGGIFHKIKTKKLCYGEITGCADLEAIKYSKFPTVELVEKVFKSSYGENTALLSQLADIIALDIAYNQMVEFVELMHNSIDKMRAQMSAADFKMATPLKERLTQLLQMAKANLARDREIILDTIREGAKPIEALVYSVNTEIERKQAVRKKLMARYQGGA